MGVIQDSHSGLAGGTRDLLEVSGLLEQQLEAKQDTSVCRTDHSLLLRAEHPHKRIQEPVLGNQLQPRFGSRVMRALRNMIKPPHSNC